MGHQVNCGEPFIKEMRSTRFRHWNSTTVDLGGRSEFSKSQANARLMQIYLSIDLNHSESLFTGKAPLSTSWTLLESGLRSVHPRSEQLTRLVALVSGWKMLLCNTFDLLWTSQTASAFSLTFEIEPPKATIPGNGRRRSRTILVRIRNGPMRRRRAL